MKTQIYALYINSKEMYEFDVFGTKHLITPYKNTRRTRYQPRPAKFISLSEPSLCMDISFFIYSSKLLPNSSGGFTLVYTLLRLNNEHCMQKKFSITRFLSSQTQTKNSQEGRQGPVYQSSSIYTYILFFRTYSILTVCCFHIIHIFSSSKLIRFTDTRIFCQERRLYPLVITRPSQHSASI
jgi:hypothetical protein